MKKHTCCEREIFPSAVLHWNYRGFTEFPLRELQGDEADITDIYLKENLISRLPSDIASLERLESLYLSGNDIRELPGEIGKLLHLKCLDLSGNRLVRLPEQIGDVTNLKFLILDDNELTELPLRLNELRALRYLSVCDNKLRWVPQRPVYNYHHCEFKFWRNRDLKVIPYSLWYHMFRDQPTRSLNIGCLGKTRSQTRSTNLCQLEFEIGEVNWKIEIDIPPHYFNVIQCDTNSPASLLELSKRTFYEVLCLKAKHLSDNYFSIYADVVNKINKDCNGNQNSYTINYDQENKNDKFNLNMDHGKTAWKSDKCCSMGHNCQYVPKDLIDKYFYYLPNHIKYDLCNGPISRCENINCKRPVFDYASFNFCIGKMLLIDKTEDAILSAVFCSKHCADTWKSGKMVSIRWNMMSKH